MSEAGEANVSPFPEVLFPRASVKARGVFDKLLWNSVTENALPEAVNLVLSGRFRRSEIFEIATKYHVNLSVQFRGDWERLFVEMSYFFLNGAGIGAREKAFLREYAAAFHLTDRANELVQAAARRHFLDFVRVAVADKQLTDAKWASIQALATKLKMPEDAVKAAYSEAAGPLLQAELTQLTRGEMLSEPDWWKFEAVSKSLRMGALFTPETEKAIALCRLRWQTTQGCLGPVTPKDLFLKKDEKCFFQGQAQWFENRKVRQRGASASADALTLICEGDLVLTDRRVILRATGNDNRELVWSEVVAVSRSNWRQFALERARGRTPTIVVTRGDSHDATLSALIAEQLLRAANGCTPEVVNLVSQPGFLTALQSQVSNGEPIAEPTFADFNAPAIAHLQSIPLDLKKYKLQHLEAAIRAALIEVISNGGGLSEKIDAIRAVSAEISGETAELIARTETARAFCNGRENGWTESKIVSGKQWLLSGNPCKLCKALNGKKVGLKEPFAKAGDVLDGVKIKRDILNPPAHDGCACDIGPVWSREVTGETN